MYTRAYQDDGRRLVLTGSGVLTGPELVSVTRRLVEEEDAARRVRAVLVLLHDVTRLEVSADDIRRVVDIDRLLVRLIPTAAVAIVAPKDEVYGMARMWELMGAEFTGWNTSVVRTLEEAEEWLGSGKQ